MAAVMSELERRALAIWQARELMFPRFVRRMKPDDWDRASGAWNAVLEMAKEAKAPLCGEAARSHSTTP